MFLNKNSFPTKSRKTTLTQLSTAKINSQFKRKSSTIWMRSPESLTTSKVLSQTRNQGQQNTMGTTIQCMWSRSRIWITRILHPHISSSKWRTLINFGIMYIQMSLNNHLVRYNIRVIWRFSTNKRDLILFLALISRFLIISKRFCNTIKVYKMLVLKLKSRTSNW